MIAHCARLDGSLTVIYSIINLEPQKGTRSGDKIAPVSPAMQCVLTTCCQSFEVSGDFQGCLTVKARSRWNLYAL